jgi:hypothetical protein
MKTEVRLGKADIKKPAATTAVTMQGLWRLVFWGSGAATAMLIAVLAGRGVVASQRAAVAMATLGGTSVAVMQPGPAPAPVTPHPPDGQIETKRLADAVRDLAADDDQIKSRLAAVEHSMDDVTGSIAQQAARAATATATPSPWPDGPAVPATPAAIAAVVAPPLAMPMEYGVDIGSALSIQALRARWAGIHSAHPELFDGLVPTVTLRDTPRSNRPELRLVVGPLAGADVATQLCGVLASYHLFCQPTIFAGQHLALQ